MRILIVLIALVVLPFLLGGAVGVNSVWEAQAGSTAANVNGGGFNPEGSNFVADWAISSATGATPTVTSATYTCNATTDNNAYLFIQSGTNAFPGWYKITNCTTGTITLDAAVGHVVKYVSGAQRAFTSNSSAGAGSAASLTSIVATIDYSQQTAAAVALTNGANLTGTTNFTSASNSFTQAMVGNIIHVTAITGTGCVAGWYEITNYTSAGTVVIDRTVCPTNDGSSGTFKIGGAMSLNSTLDDDWFELGVGTNDSGSHVFFVKNGAYSTGENVSIAAAGGTRAPIRMVGYNSYRADGFSGNLGANMPVINVGSNAITFAGGNWTMQNLSITGTGATVVSDTTGVVGFKWVKIVNTSTTAARAALNLGVSGGSVTASELISYRGRAVQSGNAVRILYNFIHDSDVGVYTSASAAFEIVGNIIASNVSYAVQFTTTALTLSSPMVLQNTLYGAENKQGVGVDLITGTNAITIRNNIIYGFTTGINHADANQNILVSDYMDFYNNTSDVVGWIKGPHDIALAPQFSSVSQVTGTAGAFTAGNDRLVDTSKNFTTLGVVAGRDFLYIKSGTGSTAGIYGVSSIATTTNPNDTLVLDIAPGTNTTTDKVYQLTIGQNFAIGANLKAAGYPGVFPGGYSTGYLDIGAVQRQEPTGGGGGGSYSFVGK